MDGWMGGWVEGWMDNGDDDDDRKSQKNQKNQKNLKNLKNLKFQNFKIFYIFFLFFFILKKHEKDGSITSMMFLFEINLALLLCCVLWFQNPPKYAYMAKVRRQCRVTLELVDNFMHNISVV